MPAELIRMLKSSCAGLVLVLGLAWPSLANEPVDETALRHYASQRQVKRVEAEAKRLAALNPGWVIPADLWTARPSGADERPLWALFAADDMARLKLAIADRQKAEPGWKPSDDLAGKIRRKETRAEILKKSASGKWTDVAELAASLEQLGRSDDVELIWNVAEGFARTDRVPDAVSLYKDVLTNRSDPKERIATIHKAIALLPIADVESLLALGRSNEAGVSEFASISIAVTRARISAILHDERKEPIGPAEMALFEAYAKGAADPGQPGLLGWLALKQGQHSQALVWFKHAIGQGGDAMIAHGLALTLLRLGQRLDAEEVAYAWRDSLINNAILFVDILEDDLTKPVPPLIDAERLARYSRVTLETRSGEGAQAMAWYAYNNCQFETALGWFQRASAWLPKEATIYGQALSLQRLKRQREFLELVNRYDGLFPKVVALVIPDGRETLPGPCDTTPARAQGAMRMARTDVRIPSADGRITDGSAAVIKRAEFPLPVTPENPLRFGPPLTPSPDGWRSVRPEQRPLVARRVPGVMAMPYERFGFALLPGWNGIQVPADIRAGDRTPATGTLWARRDLPNARVHAHNVIPSLLDSQGLAQTAQRFRR